MKQETIEKYRLLFARRLKTLRLLRGYTQEELSELLNISDRHYRRYESGQTSVPLLTMFTLAEVLNVEYNYLFFGRHILDLIFEQAFRTMPDEMYVSYLDKISQLIHIDYDAPAGDLGPVIVDLYNYGVNHRFDKPLRQIDRELRLVTAYYEKNKLGIDTPSNINLQKDCE